MGVTVDESCAHDDTRVELSSGDLFTSQSGSVYLVVYDPEAEENRVVNLSQLSMLHTPAEEITKTAAFKRRFLTGTKVTLTQEQPFE